MPADSENMLSTVKLSQEEAQVTTHHARPKILHVLEATLGGTLRFMEDIMNCSTDMPYDMGWVYSTKRANAGLPPALTKAASIGWSTFRLEMSRAVEPFGDAKSALELRRVIRGYRPDVVHCHSSKAGALSRLATLAMADAPKVVYTPHSLAIHLGRQYVLVERALSSRTDCFVAVSAGEREEIVNCGVAPGDKINVVSPGIDTNYFMPLQRREARQRLGISDDACVLLGVGRLTDQKDPLGFVEVVKRLSESIPNLCAIWVGDGEMRQSLEERAATLGIAGKVMLTGWQTDVRPYLAASNLLLSTSRYESFGYMVAEALAMQRPVVATAVNGTTDILRGDLKAYLYAPGAYDQAALLANLVLQSAEMQLRLGALGRETIKRFFSHNEMRKSLQSCYEGVLAA